MLHRTRRVCELIIFLTNRFGLLGWGRRGNYLCHGIDRMRRGWRRCRSGWREIGCEFTQLRINVVNKPVLRSKTEKIINRKIRPSVFLLTKTTCLEWLENNLALPHPVLSNKRERSLWIVVRYFCKKHFRQRRGTTTQTLIALHDGQLHPANNHSNGWFKPKQYLQGAVRSGINRQNPSPPHHKAEINT